MPNITFKTQIYSYIVIKHLLLKKYKLIFKLIQNKQYDKIYQYVYNTKINIKPIKPKKQKLKPKKLKNNLLMLCNYTKCRKLEH